MTNRYSKRHYEDIADVLRTVKERVRSGDLGVGVMDYAIQNGLADLFEKDNPRFNRARFIARSEIGDMLG